MPTIRSDELRAFATALLEAGGMRADHARQTADLLTWANLRGVDSHGVLRIPRYVEMIELGMIVPASDPVLLSEFGAVAVLDGRKCPGAVGMNAAADKAAELAERNGIGWCTIRNTSHCGAIGFFTTRLAERSLVSIGMSASKPLMAYHGARGEAVSTNPLSIGVPVSDGAPIVLDMSTAAVALGKIMAAKDAGRPIPQGWGVDAAGRPTTDPTQVAAVQPMAGPKGSGLSLMIELLTSVMPGLPIIAPALLGAKVDAFNGTIVAIDPRAFGDPDGFAQGVSALRDAIHGLSPIEPGGGVLLPGERGAGVGIQRGEAGVPIVEGTAKRLRELAGKLGCPVPSSFAASA